MQKENISLTQLMALTFTFLLGSAIIMGVGTDAKQDVWIAIIIATGIGIGIMYFYHSISTLLPGKNLYEIIDYCFKRPIAVSLSLGYITYFIYISSRVTRDFSELITTAILPITPIEVITLAFMLVISYISYLGFEVLARVTEIFIPYLIGFLFLLMIFLLGSGELDMHHIQPILGNGIQPILKALFPSLITFPFGELVVFTVVFSTVTRLKKSKKAALWSVILAGCFLFIGSILVLLSLGAELIEFRSFPLLNAARQVSIGNFIERIDALVVFIMMLGVLVKCSVFLYGGLKGLEYIFKIPYRYFTFPISMLITVFSNLISHDFMEHKDEGLRFVTSYMHPPFQFFFPALILVIMVWKSKKQKSSKGGVGL